MVRQRKGLKRIVKTIIVGEKKYFPTLVKMMYLNLKKDKVKLCVHT